MTMSAKAKNNQVIFFETFIWQRKNQGAAAETRMNGTLPGYGFERTKPFVATTVFHWFRPNEGNISGPWQPIGGRIAWDGSVTFWKDQLRSMMAANIDAVYLHLIDSFEDSRLTFFEAYAELRNRGWDVPKIAPFIDPNILFGKNPIDVATPKGKDAFASHFVRFYDQYFSKNTDEHAASYLLTIDGNLVLSTWWVYWCLQNLEKFSREDLTSRLKKALEKKIPQLSSGIHMITTALIDPDLSFAEERAVMFSGYAYAIHSVHKGIDVWHVQPGYWDQNIRSPGYFLPRDGGKNYKRAWEAVVSALPYVQRVYIESWNEYDEGSGIYPADPNGLFINESMHKNIDRYSDTDDQYEYVKTTAAGAAKINGRPSLNAKVLTYVVVKHDSDGITIDFALRNDGNSYWANEDKLTLAIVGDSGVELTSKIIMSQQPLGIVRGEVVHLEIWLSYQDMMRNKKNQAVILSGKTLISAAKPLVLDI
jgi:hypothetical protein